MQIQNADTVILILCLVVNWILYIRYNRCIHHPSATLVFHVFDETERTVLKMNQNVTHTHLEKIKCVLEKLLPSSVQLYNILVCQLSGDGVEREIVVNEDIDEDNVAILVNNKLESPKNIFSMFCTDNCKGILKRFLRDHVDWTVKSEFAVSFVKDKLP